MQYDKFTRIIHTGLALTILLQLVSEQLMQPLRPDQPPPDALEAMFFIIHQYIGFTVLVLVGLRFTEFMDSPEAARNRLFPWLTAEGRRALGHDIRYELPKWLYGRLKAPDEENVIAATVHGLGLTLAFALGMTGVMLFIGTSPDGDMEAPTRLIQESHNVMGTLMWIFICGHAGMAMAHQFSGHRALQRIFSLKKGI